MIFLRSLNILGGYPLYSISQKSLFVNILFLLKINSEINSKIFFKTGELFFPNQLTNAFDYDIIVSSKDEITRGYDVGILQCLEESKMKYIVEVNAKYLVSIEAETALSAEHAVLEYDGIWGALAFDVDAMKTETFRGACIHCETISIHELWDMSNDYRRAWATNANAIDDYKSADNEVKRIEEMLELAKENRAFAQQNVYNAKKECAEVNEKLGIRDN